MKKIARVSLTVLPLVVALLCYGCKIKTTTIAKNLNQPKNITEVQLTFTDQGHFLNQNHVFSPDDQWLVFDHRNDGTEIQQNGSIGMVNLATKVKKIIYTAAGQTEYGPGVGAAAFNPQTDEVVFISGLANADAERPYAYTRRTAIAVKPFASSPPEHLDARDVVAPYTIGALRGGTHAYSFSGDGTSVSFTYNDAIMHELAEKDGSVSDLRTVGIMLPEGPVAVVDADTSENFGGRMFSAVIAKVTEFPRPGSDEISKAYEEGWVGTKGYTKSNGQVQNKALAFLGDVRGEDSQTFTEVFIVDLPEQGIGKQQVAAMQASESTRPMPPIGVQQRRLTFTQDRKFRGVQGPRQWMRSTPDGAQLFFTMKDDVGLVQIFAISPNGGTIEQITKNSFSLDTGFSIHPQGEYVAYGHSEDLYLTHLKTGATEKVLIKTTYESTGLSNINWSSNGHLLAYNRKVKCPTGAYYHIFLIQLH